MRAPTNHLDSVMWSLCHNATENANLIIGPAVPLFSRLVQKIMAQLGTRREGLTKTELTEEWMLWLTTRLSSLASCTTLWQHTYGLLVKTSGSAIEWRHASASCTRRLTAALCSVPYPRLASKLEPGLWHKATLIHWLIVLPMRSLSYMLGHRHSELLQR